MKRTITVIALLAALFLASAATASAATGTKNISVKFMNISIQDTLSHDLFMCRDANDNEVIPFVYEGTTFVPIRTVARVLYKDIEWDAVTNSISITTPQHLKKWVPWSTDERQEGYSERKQPTKTIPVTYRNIRILVDGKEITPTDANGKVVEPFIYEGTTFVPLRAISEAFGAEVEWKRDIDFETYVDNAKITITTDRLTYSDLDKYTYGTTWRGDDSVVGKRLDELFPDIPKWDTLFAYNLSTKKDEVAEVGGVQSHRGTHSPYNAISFMSTKEHAAEVKAYIHDPVNKTKLQGIIDDAAKIFGENAAMYIRAEHSTGTSSTVYYSELWYPSFMYREPEVIEEL